MRVSNIHQFTEHHRFAVVRHFSLSQLDMSVLNAMYQPMVGAFAIGLYMTLYHQLPEGRMGYSSLEQQRKLFLALDLEPGEKGRKYLIEQTSRLEAIGLLQTSRKFVPAADDTVYEYELQAPLDPVEFFKNQHFTLLLRDKIGKYAVLAVKEQFWNEPPSELQDAGVQSENLTVPFYELFRLNTQVIDFEFEQALQEIAVSVQPDKQESRGVPDVASQGFGYADIISRFPRGSLNRGHVEELKHQPGQLVFLNMLAKKYRLSLRELVRLLDEDGSFKDDGEPDQDLLNYKANSYFRQGKKREEDRQRWLSQQWPEQSEAGAAGEAGLWPSEGGAGEQGGKHSGQAGLLAMEYALEVPQLFQGKLSAYEYMLLLRREPYTVVLERFFLNGMLTENILNIYAKLNINYKLSDPVLNVLTHHLHTLKGASWTERYIESIATNMLAKHVGTYEQAVAYFRAELRKRAELSAGKSGGGAAASRGRGSSASGRGKAASGGGQRPRIQMIEENAGQGAAPSSDELERIRKLAERIDGKKRS
ncbi:DnaD domain protein [Paenibacillus sp. y28]|uniref:DnaD domain protein n=1 Tax=Paenibacillus sp. y28 TaxID=3129110 RepID=UPI0030176F1E